MGPKDLGLWDRRRDPKVPHTGPTARPLWKGEVGGQSPEAQ